MVEEKIKSVQPKTGKNHRFFGSRFLKLHNMRDPKWGPQDKFAQYVGLTTLHEKDQKLTVLARTADMKKKLRTIRALNKEVRLDRENLKVAVIGDSQRKKNILQNHKELQRLYQHMPSHLIIENMDQRTFVKRKELDRLLDKKKKISLKYETELIEFSKFKDRIKYTNCELKDDVKSRKIRMEIKNSETRLKAIRTINRAYDRMINTMMHDSLYFEPVLDALQEDIIEQEQFINTTIRLGRPALANLEKQQHEFNKLDAQTKKANAERIETLKMFRNRIEENNTLVKDLVRRDSDFEINVKRYKRETDSMTDLKRQLEDVEKDVKLLQMSTACVRPDEIYPRLKKQQRDTVRMKDNVVQKERDRNLAIEKDVHATVKLEQLAHNLTKAETERTDQMKLHTDEIAAEGVAKQKLEIEINERSEMLSMLKSTFQHYVDVLRHVGTPTKPLRPVYNNADLALPLLKFTAIPAKAKAPPPFEEDADKLLDLIKTRVGVLMKKYDKEKSDAELAAAANMYHNDIVKDMHDEAVRACQIHSDSVVELRSVIDDPAVPSRRKLKAVANKIVEANTKKED